jgi:two-component system sensor histidine kinase QseC
MIQTRSIQARLLLLLLSVATVVWVSAAAVTWVDAQHELDELLDGHLAQAASLLVLQADGDDDDISDAPILHKYTPLVAFQVFIGGQLITRSSNAGLTPLSVVNSGFSSVRDATGAQWRVFATHSARHDVTAFVGEQIQSRQAILWAVMRSMLWPILIALPLFALAVVWSVRKGLMPLHQLSTALQSRPTSPGEPVPLQGMPHELQPLVRALNTLLARIDSMVLMERRFTADAAHELRTPIAGIRAQAQVAMGAGENEPERRHALELTLAGCDRATRLVEQLLTLARLEDTGCTGGAMTDLCGVARRVAADLAPVALGRKQELELDISDACPLAAPEILLTVLVRNLVDNALRYSPDGARVLVCVRHEAGAVVFQVQDGGPGMTGEQIQRLGERFYRVLGNEQPGSGLGWSIVRRLADVFVAKVEVIRSESLGGLSVTVRWPL